MLYVILLLIGILIWFVVSGLGDIIERLKVLEYEQNRQFNELNERINMLNSDVEDANKELLDISRSIDGMKPPKQKFEDY